MRSRLRRLRSIGDILTSAEMVGELEDINQKIAQNVSDPNPAVEATLRTKTFVTKGAKAAERATGQVGMAPWLKGVEAKRGPIARAVQSARS